jgi:hypothetical protein
MTAMIHLISIPVTNTSVNPARSTGPALFAGGEYIGQLWLFWVAPRNACKAHGGTLRDRTDNDEDEEEGQQCLGNEAGCEAVLARAEFAEAVRCKATSDPSMAD